MRSVEGIIEVLEKTGQVDGDVFWRHRSGRTNPPGWLFGRERYLGPLVPVLALSLSQVAWLRQLRVMGVTPGRVNVLVRDINGGWRS